MNLLDNIQIQIKDLNKFNELNSIQKSKSIKNIKTLGERILNKKNKVKKKRKIRERKIIRSYKTYIVSKEWTKRKNKFFQRNGKICSCCNSKNYIQLHHKVYSGEYGYEPDNHLVALCSSCHNLFHESYGVKSDMTKETNSFILEMKKSIHIKKEIELLDQFIKNI